MLKCLYYICFMKQTLVTLNEWNVMGEKWRITARDLALAREHRDISTFHHNLPNAKVGFNHYLSEQTSNSTLFVIPYIFLLNHYLHLYATPLYFLHFVNIVFYYTLYNYISLKSSPNFRWYINIKVLLILQLTMEVNLNGAEYNKTTISLQQYIWRYQSIVVAVF